jgi:hypothetical protein
VEIPYLVVAGALTGKGRSGLSAPKPCGVTDLVSFEAFGFFGSRPLRFCPFAMMFLLPGTMPAVKGGTHPAAASSKRSRGGAASRTGEGERHEALVVVGPARRRSRGRPVNGIENRESQTTGLAPPSTLIAVPVT